MSGYTLKQNMAEHPEWFLPDRPSPSFQHTQQQFAELESRLRAVEATSGRLNTDYLGHLVSNIGDVVSEFVRGFVAQEMAKAVEPLKQQAELVQKRLSQLQSETIVGDRLYSLIEVRGVQESDRTIRGWATRFETDRVGDRVRPKGCLPLNLPIPLLLGHDTSKIVGQVVAAAPDEEGVQFTAKIARIDDSDSDLARNCESCWDGLRAGLYRGVSIGFLPLESNLIRDERGAITGREYVRWDWTELSVVACPALPSAQVLSVSAVRSIDQESAGQRQNVVVTLQRELADLRRDMAQLQDRTIPNYVGVWDAADTYQRGSVVTHGGLWIALTDTSAKPGETGDWKLCVRKPADGASAYDLARKHGYRGTEAEFSAWLHGGAATPRPVIA